MPGDVLVGVAAALWGAGAAGRADAGPTVAAAVASAFLYLFGLADNDIVGAATDGAERPIPAGTLSLASARVARGLCLLAVLVVAALASLPPLWWCAALALCLTEVLYNRTKRCVLMGLCRGLNVVCGALSVAGTTPFSCRAVAAVSSVAAIWTVYIAAVTRHSEGEGEDPVRRRRVGFLIGALVYLQLGVLLVFHLLAPTLVSRNLLLAGAALLLALRLMKRMFPKVSAS